jgi:hypothetical protein
MRTQLPERLEGIRARLAEVEDAYEQECNDRDWAEQYGEVFDPRESDTMAWIQRAEQDIDLAPLVAAAKAKGMGRRAIAEAMFDAAEPVECSIERKPRCIDARIGVQDETDLDSWDAELAAEFLALSTADRRAVCDHLNGFLSHNGTLSYEDSYAGVALVVDADALAEALGLTADDE